MDELLRLLDDARAEERQGARSRERLLRHIADEGATLAGTLVNLAERGEAVAVRTTYGRSYQGRIRLVGADFCVVASEGGDVWLHFDAVATIRPPAGPSQLVATGDRAAIDLLLVEALARVADERPRVVLTLGTGETLAGELQTVGVDVVTLRLDGAGSRSYVSASSIRAVLRSG